MHSNVVLLKTDITSGFCSLVAVKVTFVVSGARSSTFLLQQLQFKKPLQFVESFFKLFYTTD